MCVTQVTSIMTTFYIHVWHDSFIFGTWLIRMWDMTHSCIHMTHSHVCDTGNIDHDHLLYPDWKVDGRYVCVCDMTHCYVCVCDMTHCYVCVCDMAQWHVFECICICDMTHWCVCVWYDSLMCVRMYASVWIDPSVCACVIWLWHDAFVCVWENDSLVCVCVIWLCGKCTCDMTHLYMYVWHDSRVYVCGAWLIDMCMCDKTCWYVCVCHDALVCVWENDSLVCVCVIW